MESNGVKENGETLDLMNVSSSNGLLEKINAKLEQPDEESCEEYQENIDIMDFCDVKIEPDANELIDEGSDEPVNNSCKISFVENGDGEEESNESSNGASFYGFGVEACYEGKKLFCVSLQGSAHLLL